MMDMESRSARKWGMLCHLSALLGYTLVPFGNLLGPLLIWLLKKEDFAFVDEQGKESLNFQIAVTVYLIIAGLLTLVLIGFVLIVVIYVAAVVFVIIASLKANDGVRYRYPYIFRLIN
jgi:uncharacterized protein